MLADGVDIVVIDVATDAQRDHAEGALIDYDSSSRADRQRQLARLGDVSAHGRALHLIEADLYRLASPTEAAPLSS